MTEKIEKFELLGFRMEPLDDNEFREALTKYVTDIERDADVVSTEDFNEFVLDLMERLLWTRQEIKLREKHPDMLAKRRVQAKAPRTWCDAECTYHKFHDAGGTPIDWDGNPIPVDQPFPARLNDDNRKEN